MLRLAITLFFNILRAKTRDMEACPASSKFVHVEISAVFQAKAQLSNSAIHAVPVYNADHSFSLCLASEYDAAKFACPISVFYYSTHQPSIFGNAKQKILPDWVQVH